MAKQYHYEVRFFLDSEFLFAIDGSIVTEKELESLLKEVIKEKQNVHISSKNRKS